MVAPTGIPYNHFQSVSFTLKRTTSRNDLYGGITQVLEQGTPRWFATYKTAPLSEIQRRVFLAFYDRLKGGLVPFVGYDPSIPVPVGYMDFGLPAGFSGLTSISSISSTGFVVGGLPAAFELVPGDLIGLIQGDNYALHRVVVGGVGTTISVSVIPDVITSIYTAPTGNVLRPGCNMIIDPNSWQHNAEAGTLSTLSFSASQKII